MSAPPADCPHRPPCPGCPRFGEPGIAPSARLLLDGLAEAHGIAHARMPCGAAAGFRHRARLAIRGRVGSPKLGLFESGSHRVVHIPGCIVQHPLINRVAAVVRRALAEERLSCYSDKARLGLARYLQVVVERSSQTAQVVLVANSDAPGPVAACLDLVRERLGAQLHSLWFNAHTGHTNTILGPQFVRLCGPEAIIERCGGIAVHYPPGAFGQSNPEIAGRIIEYVRALVPPGARVAEFYAGVGAIGLSLIDAALELRVNEVAPQSLHGLSLGVAALDPLARAKISIFPGPAAAALEAAHGAGVVIADPPRKGLDAALIAGLVANPPERFIYVSCGLESLLADTTRLTADGAMRLAQLASFNLMPYTEHVESVACFERA